MHKGQDQVNIVEVYLTLSHKYGDDLNLRFYNVKISPGSGLSFVSILGLIWASFPKANTVELQ